MALLFSATLFLSAFLLFGVQPLCARMALPSLGGSPAVWNTCMVFFQAGLLAGYAYAHVAPRLLGARLHAVCHLAVFALALALLPVAMGQADTTPEWPVLWLLGRLVVAAGAPFFLLASTAPLLQRWFHQASGGRDPYFLYAASNLGSFAALAAYPFVIEPALDLPAQASWWKWGYVALACGVAACAFLLWKKGPVAEPTVRAGVRPALGTRLRWFLLALVPSSLLLSVTSHLTTDIAPVPLLWVAPLGLYLATFVLVFARKPPVPHALILRWQPIVVITLTVVWLSEATEPLWLVLGIHVLGFLWVTLACHGELARNRPEAQHLTEFYLWLAVGGVAGGAFNALVAPLVFPGLAELPLLLVTSCVLLPTTLPGAVPPTTAFNWVRIDWTDLIWAAAVGLLALLTVLLAARSSWWPLPPGPGTVAVALGVPLVLALLAHARPVRLAASLAAIFLASLGLPSVHGTTIYQERSFFGVHRVTVQDDFRTLIHGNTVHGKQNLSRPREPLTYYTRSGPIGQLLHSLKGDQRLQRVGLIGLGAGALACYVEPGQHWTFVEIDPAVIHIARTQFTYLKSAGAPVEVLQGDGRLTVAASSDRFGLLIVDAFGSDSIPIHLLTREALQVYRAHLTADGLLAFHVSNRYLDLTPVLARHATDMKWLCLVQEDRSVTARAEAQGKSPSIWVVLAPNRDALAALGSRWLPAAASTTMPAWTDHYSNILSILKAADAN